MRPTARTFRALLPLYPYAMEALDLRGYDLVVSRSSAWAHGVIADDHAVHVCYCHNPFRYAWNAREETLRAPRPAAPRRARVRLPALAPVGLDRRPARRPLRGELGDDAAAHRALLRARRRRSSTRRCETERFAPGRRGDDYVVLVRADAAQAHGPRGARRSTRCSRPLTVIGDGPDARRLRRMAGPTVRFAGRVSDDEARRAARVVPRARRHRDRGVRHRRRRGAGRGPAGHRAARGRRARDGRGGRDRGVLRRADAGRAGDGGRAFDPLAVDPQACVANAAALRRRALRGTGSPSVVADAGTRRGSTRPRARTPARAARPRWRGARG